MWHNHHSTAKIRLSAAALGEEHGAAAVFLRTAAHYGTMPVRVITVDLWNTLVGAAGNAQRQAQRRRSIRRCVEQLGRKLPEAAITAALQETWRYYTTVWRGEHRTPTPAELAAVLWRFLGLPEEQALIERLAEELAEGVLVAPPPLLPQVRETLIQLAGRYRLAVISDTAFSPGRVLRELLRRYGLAELFSAYSFSDETGVAKPHPRAYLTVLEQFHARPEEALHIGDLEDTDIRGAKQLGMRAILFLGDPDSEFPPPEQTAADCVAYNWSSVPEFLLQLEGSDRADTAARSSA